MKSYPNSKLKNLGQALKDVESKYGVNALLTLGIAINESGYGNSNIAWTKQPICLQLTMQILMQRHPLPLQ